jgi:excisionase family DNA binding protein
MSTTTKPSPDAPAAWLLDVDTMAAMLHCSARHIYRLADSGRMPAPVRLGACLRWSRSAIEQWIAEGCPSVRKAGQ